MSACRIFSLAAMELPFVSSLEGFCLVVGSIIPRGEKPHARFYRPQKHGQTIPLPLFGWVGDSMVHESSRKKTRTGESESWVFNFNHGLSRNALASRTDCFSMDAGMPLGWCCSGGFLRLPLLASCGGHLMTALRDLTSNATARATIIQIISPGSRFTFSWSGPGEACGNLKESCFKKCSS